MEERAFDAEDVMSTLANGELKGPITPGKREGEWKGKIIYQPFGTRR
jgi:hypothetical protein